MEGQNGNIHHKKNLQPLAQKKTAGIEETNKYLKIKMLVKQVMNDR